MLITLPNAVDKEFINMTIDTTLHHSIPEDIGYHLLRHYEWLESAVIFVYTQSYEEVIKVKGKDLRLCHRSTGGA